MSEQRIVEVVYIKSSLTEVWDALTNPDLTERYWFGTRIDSQWTVGSKVLYIRNGDITDEHVVLAVDEPHGFSHTFKPVFGEFQSEAPSRVTVALDENSGVVRLTVVHDDFARESKVFPACRQGWPMILSNLKTLLETGTPLPPFTFPPQ